MSCPSIRLLHTCSSYNAILGKARIEHGASDSIDEVGEISTTNVINFLQTSSAKLTDDGRYYCSATSMIMQGDFNGCVTVRVLGKTHTPLCCAVSTEYD